MPIPRYGVLCGRIVDCEPERDFDTPHYQIHIKAAGHDYRVTINVRSSMAPTAVLFHVERDFQHPVVDQLGGLPEGFTALPSRPGGLALDYVRGNLFERHKMHPLRHSVPGPDNDLIDRVDHYVRRAIADRRARAYAYGAAWKPEMRHRDKVFGFRPSAGVHDIHMNQGNDRHRRRDDGVYQDGALILHFPAEDQWVAFFIAFQSQSWQTDDRTGHRIRYAGIDEQLHFKPRWRRPSEPRRAKHRRRR